MKKYHYKKRLVKNTNIRKKKGDTIIDTIGI